MSDMQGLSRRDDHVVHVVNSLAAGGIETFVTQLAEHQSMHLRVSIIVIFHATELGLEGVKERDHVARLEGAGVTVQFLKSAKRARFLAKAYYYNRALTALQATIVNSHTYRATLFHQLGLRREPLVYTHHTAILFTAPAKFRFLDGAVRRYIANSSAGAKTLEAYTKTPVSVIYHGVTFPKQHVTAHDKQTDKFIIVHVGSLRPEKRQDRILDIAEVLRHQRPELEDKILFRIIGDGPLRSELVAAAQQRGLTGMVEFAGEKDDVYPFLVQSDVYLQTSDLEGVPISLVEAAWAELPLVSTTAGGCAEVFTDGEAGLLIAPNDISGYVSAITRLYDDPALVTRMKAGAKQVATHFNMDNCCTETLHIYNLAKTNSQGI